MKPFFKTSALFCILLGSFNLLTWVFLISTGKVNHIDEQIVSLVFHWFSEITTAILLIVAGIALIKKWKKSRQLFYLSLGFLFNAVQGAVIYYIVHFELPLLIMLSLFTVATIFYGIINFTGFYDLLFLTLGISIYGCINVLGNAFQNTDLVYIYYTIPVFLFLCILTVYSFLHKTKTDTL